MNNTNNTAAIVNNPMQTHEAITVANKIEQIKGDMVDMKKRGVDRFYSSAEINVEDAVDFLVSGDVKAAAESLERAAKYAYGILDARFAAFVVTE